MSYRGPQPKRATLQASAMFRWAGHTATWNQWVSASAGVPAAGIGETDYYRQQLITGSFGNSINPRILQRQQAAGMIFDADILAVTREKFGPRDTVDWNGDSFRVESEPVQSKINQLWVSQLKRGQ